MSIANVVRSMLTISFHQGGSLYSSIIQCANYGSVDNKISAGFMFLTNFAINHLNKITLNHKSLYKNY